MSNLYIKAQTLTDIADAIRNKTGASAMMTPSQMASAIGSISGGDTTLEDELITGELNNYENSRVTTIRPYAFYSYQLLTTVSFPNVTSIGSYAFGYCTSLTTVSFPVVTSIKSYAFYSCTSLTTINFPKATHIESYAFRYCYSLTAASFPVATIIGSNAFQYCSALTTASFPSAMSIGSYAFRNCYNLLSLYLLGSSVPTLTNISAFASTPISNYTTSTGGVYGSIYVPASLYSSYITATNWTRFSSRFVSV